MADTVTRPAKRVKVEGENDPNESGRSYRRRSPPSTTDNDRYYRPGHDRGAHARADTDRSPRNHDYYRPRRRSASPRRNHPQATDQPSKSKKSKKDRRENPSTRIRSLRNLLARGTLPATVKQEKERELAALLFDQQKETMKNNAKKNLKRYHFIRFVERQKATRTLKQLKKVQEHSKNPPADLEQKIHEAEVDLNYTLYAPLGGKYVAIYARDDSPDSNPTPLPRNLSRMKKRDYAILSDEQKRLIEIASMEAAGTLHLADGKNGARPPMWFTVEQKMKEGQAALDALRNEQWSAEQTSNLVVGSGTRKTPDWLDDDGVIDPEDLDSEPDEDGGAAVGTVDEDEDMSDGDGGFFEKR